jgi:TolB-like protein
MNTNIHTKRLFFKRLRSDQFCQYLLYALIFWFTNLSYSPAQITVALGEFQNQSDKFYLDQWQQTIPDLLQTRLSESEKLILLERRKLKEVLEEQALSLSGLTDSSNVREIGTLLESDYIIFGSINEIGSEYRIDASVVKISTGQTQSEKVVSPDRDHLSQMIDLLGNNILYNLTGEGEYRDRVKLGKSPTLYFLGATVGLGIGTLIASNQYQKYLDDYRNNTELDKFDELYDKANRTKKISVALASLTGAAMMGTVYFWVRGRSPSEIYAQNINEIKTLPYLTYSEKNEIIVGIKIHY